MLDIRTLAHSRYKRDLLSEELWIAWDRYLTRTFSNEAEAISKSRWEKLRYGFETEFRVHVGVALFE